MTPGSNRQRTRLILGVLLGLPILFAACIQPTPVVSPSAPSATAAPKVFRFAWQEPLASEPKAPTSALRQFQVFEGLAGLGPSGIEMLGAERYDVSADGLTWTWQLRTSAKWSDGTPVKASDYVFNTLNVLDPKSASRQAGTLYVLKNAEEFNKGTVTDRTAVGIRATGDNTLVMTLKERTGNLLAQVAGYPAFWPVPQAIVEKNGDKWIEAGTFVGNGPFTIKEWSHNERMVLVPNPSYWAKKPALDRVEVKLLQDPNTGGLPGFEAAELDFASVPAGEIPRIRGGNLAPLLKFAPVPQLWAVFPDAGHKPWDDVRVRQAFYLALDRDKLSAAFNGLMTPAYILTPQTVPGNTKDLRPLTGSAADAKRLLAEAGYPNGVGFPSVTLTTQTSSDAVLFGQAAQSMWKDTLGVTVKISALERQTFSSFSNSMKTVPYDLVLNGGLADIPDPWLFLDFMIGSDGLGYYATRWKDPQYAELLPIARNEADQTKRIALYQQLEKIIIGQAGVIPWANQNLAYVTKPNISGLRIGFGTNVPVLKEINVTN